MANPEHLEILKQGVEQWNEWREEHQEIKRPELSKADLFEADLGGANLRGANISGADLRLANLREANLSGADLREANLERTELWASDLRGADLSFVNLRGGELGGANLSLATLKGSDLRLTDFNRAILAGTDLSEANLSGVSLSGTNLKGTNLRGANLSKANLRGAYLSEANLSGADLKRANLRAAYLWGANLSGADLSVANFREANLTGTEFNKAVVWRTQFDDVDLSLARGLETVQHDGPSTIGIDTIYKSRGKIPEAFLRGCGVPDEFIAYLGSMVGRPIEFYSCFISYSTKDQEFADRLYADLQAKGVRCWFAPHDIQGGKTIHEQIDEAIRRYDRLLLILSEHSIHSGWVETEIANAWERQIQQEKHVLFPVRLVSFEDLEKWKCPDPKTGKDLGREIRKYFIPDFSNWKEHDPYQVAFQKLVESLKAVVSG